MTLLLHERTRTELGAHAGLPAGSYIFHGAQGSGKASAARELARAINCQGDGAEDCGNCRLFGAGNYPDFIVVRPEDKPSITIEQIRRLLDTLALSPYRANGQRIILIDDAQVMTTEAQNALLKVIEEPPPATRFILVTNELTALLPTVRSRCVPVYFGPVAHQQISQFLVDNYGLDAAAATELAIAAEGAPGGAIALAQTPAAPQLELMRLAAKVLDQSLFERLLLAARLAADKADLALFGRAMQSQVIARLTSGTADATSTMQRLVALERFRQALAAKITPRVAVECLMVRL